MPVELSTILSSCLLRSVDTPHAPDRQCLAASPLTARAEGGVGFYVNAQAIYHVLDLSLSFITCHAHLRALILALSPVLSCTAHNPV
jgi:hypothetical protein